MTYHMIISNRENLRQIRSTKAFSKARSFSKIHVSKTEKCELKTDRILKATKHANRQLVVGYMLAGVLVMTTWMMAYGLVVA